MKGMLGACVGPLGDAYLTERALKKAANAGRQAATNEPAKPAREAGKRNAYRGGVEEDSRIRAMDRTERKIHTLLAEEDVDLLGALLLQSLEVFLRRDRHELEQEAPIALEVLEDEAHAVHHGEERILGDDHRDSGLLT